jgi:acyl carrier protein
MLETITKPAGTGTAFPEVEVEAKLKEVLLEAAQSHAAMKGIALPADSAGQASAAVRLDSLDVVSLLCDIEPILDIELKDSLVRSGGYYSVNQAMDHLMPRIKKAWEKKQK